MPILQQDMAVSLEEEKEGANKIDEVGIEQPLP